MRVATYKNISQCLKCTGTYRQEPNVISGTAFSPSIFLDHPVCPGPSTQFQCIPQENKEFTPASLANPRKLHQD
jgi:hypothetical protein